MAPARSFADWRALALVMVLAAAGLGGAPRAHAQATGQSGWTLCNQTSFIVEAAIGRPERGQNIVSGWTRLRPGECRLALTGQLQRGVHYLYGRTSSAHRGGQRQWGGPGVLCVSPREEKFQHRNPENCVIAKLEERGFREVRINKRDNWRTFFAEAEPFSMARARAAGIQRLLADAGYDNRGGSADPRRTAAAIGRFRDDVRLPANATEDQMIDQLEQLARKRADRVGLLLCNSTNARLMTAVARRRGEGWESRGWWPIAPGACARTIDDPLVQNVYYLHAIMEAREGERYLAAPGDTFCTARTRFAIIGRRDCDKRFYDTSIFVPINPPANSEGLRVLLTDREFLAPGLKPRRVELPQLAGDDAVTIVDGGTDGRQRRAPRGAGGVPTEGDSEGAAAATTDRGQPQRTQGTVRDMVGPQRPPRPAQPPQSQSPPTTAPP